MMDLKDKKDLIEIVMDLDLEEITTMMKVGIDRDQNSEKDLLGQDLTEMMEMKNLDSVDHSTERIDLEEETLETDPQEDLMVKIDPKEDLMVKIDPQEDLMVKKDPQEDLMVKKE